ncbi:RDD family protein [Solirubrobacter sp. CPCC 204708]|uniref:RDD family protein n=1 Tax=Solirubrobacter deserti TaxID=2282478 RepID=A0ABT4RPJ1_9ACTN|nr:RDD family protein [Solirubrobacter deserti]MBE2319972.1 RDD family protein [Solirubrobacter deserti]MDA0140431.1 RDD family protein [Solirubrobacter deserti]
MSAQTPFPEGSSDWPYGAPQQTGARPFAGWWSRVAAQLIDSIIVSILPLILYFVVLSSNESAAGLVIGGASLVVGLVYYAVTIGRSGPNNGQTLGKQLLNIRIVRETGEPMSAGTAILRETLIKGILMSICVIVLILDYLAPLWDSRNQAWHDKIVNTLVVQA